MRLLIPLVLLFLAGCTQMKPVGGPGDDQVAAGTDQINQAEDLVVRNELEQEVAKFLAKAQARTIYLIIGALFLYLASNRIRPALWLKDLIKGKNGCKRKD